VRALKELARSAPKRVILSCFASSIHRIQQVIDIASRVGRKVAFVGRSMVDNVEIAHDLDYLRHSRRHGRPLPGHPLIRSAQNHYPASGSQAEPMSSLSRIAVDNHRFVSVDEK